MALRRDSAFDRITPMFFIRQTSLGAIMLLSFWSPLALSQIRTDSFAPHRFLVLYRNAFIPGDAELRTAATGARITRRNEHLGIAAVQAPPSQDDATTLRLLSSQPDVAYVLHDRIVSAQRLRLRTVTAASTGVDTPTQSSGSPSQIGKLPSHGAILTVSPPTTVHPAPPAPYDTYYTETPQGWAVQQVGGYADHIPGGPATGPWNLTMGKGVRIAILDSGVDETHPNIVPNLGLNLTEVNRDPQTGYPSPCDDGTPQDQSGHGTWTASLAAGAIEPGTGQVVGVAPEATILNIKVLQRMPATNPAAPPRNTVSQVRRAVFLAGSCRASRTPS